MESLPEPNPVHKPTLSDYLQIAVTVCFRVPWTVFTTLLRRWSPWSSYHPPPLREHISRHVMTCLGNNTPGCLWDNVADRTGQNLHNSNRYGHLRRQIYQSVRRPEFSGFWICRGLSAEAIHPRDADLVLFHCHGGGYVSFHPSAGAPEHLFLAELLQRNGVTTAIFSLDYTLAPRATFPTQRDEAIAAYDWINKELGVAASKIVVAGDSAGGHLITSLLLGLHERRTAHPAEAQYHDKPAGAILISPWLNLHTSHPRALALHWEDRLSKAGLDSCHAQVMRGAPAPVAALYSNFAVDVATRGSWAEILPRRTWVSAGADELVFLYDVEDFVACARRDGAEVALDVTPGKNHTWQCAEGLAQHAKLLGMRPGEDDEGLMEGYRRIAGEVLRLVDQ
ncbi:alpha/beta hydrolase [Aspergillus clavatus NRRL 1]|uniref:Alpha/beta hydrolase fold protein n=1 Tax=Aspergillus clavatus (strain ATCC 1007 / CBS 513.65 / DSM 816 / NCTC 3887 / NRRL 1 / QM 1276 / 107) TaxID=344612 RepID=A1CAU6_ASPCL|nr:alpha/beta hydrolase fold protein [Aspergillus clavatus NRRL 1]EAW12864.1 alpha/beta hydrolase fold protein [Aspergillus clavatus NRRL 1]